MSEKEKSCLNCKTIYIGEKCPSCNESKSSESFKGEIEIFNFEKSLIAKKIGVNSNKKFAIKTK